MQLSELKKSHKSQLINHKSEFILTGVSKHTSTQAVRMTK